MVIQELLDQKATQDVHSILPEANITAAIHMLNQKHVGALLVLDAGGNIAGILSERDILRKVLEGGARLELAVSEVMTPKETLIIGHSTDNIEYAMSIMTQHQIRHLPILDQMGRICGMLSIGDIVKALLTQAHYEQKLLMDYISGKYPA